MTLLSHEIQERMTRFKAAIRRAGVKLTHQRLEIFAEVARTVAGYRRAGAEHVAVYVTADEPLEQFERLLAALPGAGPAARR